MRKSNYEKVLEFNKSFGVPISVKSQPDLFTTDPKLVAYRLSLIQEEVNELKDALTAHDFPETLDALTDVLYVVYGAFTAFGVNADDAFNAVHLSNMSKLCISEEEAQLTVDNYKKDTRYADPAYRKSADGKFWVVYDRATMKILKSINYKPVDMTKF